MAIASDSAREIFKGLENGDGAAFFERVQAQVVCAHCFELITRAIEKQILPSHMNSPSLPESTDQWANASDTTLVESVKSGNHSAYSELVKRHSTLAFRTAYLIVVLALLLTGGIAHAQIIGHIEADIPFPFHAGAAKFPAGKYTIRVEDGSDLSTMEIQSADGKSSALFEVRSAQAQKSPQSTELIFNHYGNRYFLARIFDEGEKAGSAVVDSGYSKKYGASLEAGETEHVSGRHSGS